MQLHKNSALPLRLQDGQPTVAEPVSRGHQKQHAMRLRRSATRLNEHHAEPFILRLVHLFHGILTANTPITWHVVLLLLRLI